MWEVAILHAGKVVYTLTLDRTAHTVEHRYRHMVCESQTETRMYAELLANPKAIAARLRLAQRYDLHACDRTACPRESARDNEIDRELNNAARRLNEREAQAGVVRTPTVFTCDADGDCDDDPIAHERCTVSLPR